MTQYHHSEYSSVFTCCALGNAFAMLLAVTSSAGCTKVENLKSVSLGDKALASADYASAIYHYTTAIESQPKRAALFLKRGKAQILVGNTDKAIFDFTSALQLDASLVEGYLARSEAYLKLSDPLSALNDLNFAIAQEPNRSDLHLARASTFLTLRDFDSALVDANRALELNADRATACILRGRALLNKKEFHQAIADFTTAIDIRPEAYSYWKRSQAYQALGDTTHATLDHQCAISLDPSLDFADSNLGKTLTTDLSSRGEQSILTLSTGVSSLKPDKTANPAD